ncbi:response regulator [Geomonas sp. RF6]|uniref:HD-GYP domain-containing protein n=1 Tax=Geomonas sp. RF6 TaxID=2897342 RepID=UPI001E54AB8D|nr:HD domain-containing phosphohydrolase [Geomonas sp. RF6]UFS70039.1 response regulator [Geomonas sp. RF6]
MNMFDSVTVLAVDDVEMNLRMVKLILQDLGQFVFIGAHNGVEALAALERSPDVDIVLLDLDMPVMDGFETLRQIKGNEHLREIPVIVITSDKSEVLRTLGMGANDFMARPYNPEELKLRVMNHLRSKKLSDLSHDMNNILEGEVIKKTSALKGALEQSQRAEFEISLRLGRAAEFRDLETGMHIQRVSEMSKELARLAGLPAEECDLLRHAAPLHDVGKIGIPDRILLKPGRLDDSETKIMQLHTEIGGKILSESQNFPVLKAGQIIALQHHEKWDGSGYPRGMSGTDIHIYGRIVMVVDIFDALTSERPYKKAFSIEKTLQIMEEGDGVFFDPTLLRHFLDNLSIFTDIKQEYSDDAAGSPSVLELLAMT